MAKKANKNSHTPRLIGITIIILVALVGLLAILFIAKQAHKRKEERIDHFMLAQTAYDQKDYAESLEEYKKALAESSNPVIYRKLALLYQSIGNKDEAIESYNKSLEGEANDVSAINNLANLYVEKNNYLEAENLYKRAISLSPDYVQAIINLSHLYNLQSEYEKSAELLKLHYDGSIIKSRLGIQLANAYKLSGDETNAKNTIERVLEVDPENESAKAFLNHL